MEALKIILTAAAIPSAVVAFCFWLLQRRITKNEERAEEKAKQQERLQIIILDSVNGSIRLSEATARAVQRIPNARCNGDMHAALDDIERTRQRQQRLITEAGIHDILHE
jgi:hypothetical protein